MCFVMTFMCSLQGISYAEYSVGLDKGQEIGGGVTVLKKILQELVLIRKELQAIRSSMESCLKISIDQRTIDQAVRKAIDDTSQEDGDTF